MTHPRKRPERAPKLDIRQRQTEEHDALAERKQAKGRSECGKVAFAAWHLANEALERCIAQGRPERRIYICSECNSLHLTSS